MEQLIMILISYCISFIEIVMYYEFMASRFERNRGTSSKRKWMVYIIGSIITSVTQMIPWPFPVILLLNMLILGYLGHLVLKGNIFEEFIFTMFYMVIIYLLDLMTVTIFGQTSQVSSKVNENELSYFYIQMGLISKIVLIALTKFFVRIQSNRSYSLTPKITRLMGYGFCISLASIYGLAIVFLKIAGGEFEGINLWINLVAVGIFLNIVVIYYVVQKLSDWVGREKEYETVQYQNEILIKATLEKDEMNKEVRKIWHDFNNHMSCIDMLLQMDNIEKARAYIKNMNASCQTTYMGIKTGNEMADVVLNQKFVLAKNQEIELKSSGMIEAQLNINQMDLCAILCNSLDNAIEACRKIEEKDSRKIKITFKMHKNYLLIEVVNSMQEIITNNKRLITTKKDKSRHGIGMLSMQTIVEKYRGNLEWKCENNQFLLSIILNNEQD